MLYVSALMLPNPVNGLLVVSHGSPQSVRLMNAQQLADYIRANTGWRQGQPIILDACRTGQGSNSIAEQLSKILGNSPVIAPDQYVWNTLFWEIGVFPPQSTDKNNPLNNRPDVTKPGEFRCFGNFCRY